jgi:hypothetical protein
MKQSPQWHRERSQEAERKYQAIVWGRAAPQSSPQSAAKALYPNHNSAARQFEIVRREPGAAPNTLARALYPNLKER